MEAIICINKVGCIGLNGRLPWKSKADLQHFKKMTMGKRVVVGRKTYEKLPKLKGREILVMSKEGWSLEGILNCRNVDFVIGGKEIYDLLLPHCDVIHVSRINDSSIGDTYYEIPDELKDRVINYEFEID